MYQRGTFGWFLYGITECIPMKINLLIQSLLKLYLISFLQCIPSQIGETFSGNIPERIIQEVCEVLLRDICGQKSEKS